MKSSVPGYAALREAAEIAGITPGAITRIASRRGAQKELHRIPNPQNSKLSLYKIEDLIAYRRSHEDFRKRQTPS